MRPNRKIWFIDVFTSAGFCQRGEPQHEWTLFRAILFSGRPWSACYWLLEVGAAL
jgi:hypothetical protein